MAPLTAGPKGAAATTLALQNKARRLGNRPYKLVVWQTGLKMTRFQERL